MIQKLKRKFVRISMISLSIAMILVILAINLMNWMNVKKEMGETISFLASNNGIISMERANAWAGKSKHRKNLISQSSYFIGTGSADGTVRLINQVRDETLNSEEALHMIRQAVDSGKESGFTGDYLYQTVSSANGNSVLIFLNCENYISSVKRLILFSCFVCAAGILLAFAAVMLGSRIAIRPFLRDEQKQKQFVTDASHEMKAPLAVISANMDVLALEDRDNPWIRSTQNQVSSMKKLVEELLYLSRMDEGKIPVEKKHLSLSKLAEDAAEPYQAMAEFQGKNLDLLIQPDIGLEGEEESLKRLVSILADNAVKYSSDKLPPELRVRQEGRYVIIETENIPLNPMTDEQCEMLFDRFYRADSARSRKKQNGYGIGLSIAQAIAERHGGRMEAHLTGMGSIIIRCLLPG